MADVLDRLASHWKQHRVALAAAKATSADIAAWEAKYGVRLPDDLVAYVKRVNGNFGGETLEFDHEGMSFLPLSAMVPEKEWSEQYDGAGMFVFADMLVQCYWWCVHLTPEPSERTSIFLRGSRLCLVAESLEEFLDAYIDGATRIHPGPTS
jgi:SMI1 / KNR4 family (SUKH-1)